MDKQKLLLERLGEKETVRKGNYRIFSYDATELDEDTALRLLNYEGEAWSLPYGGHQFGQYNPDLGDGRSVVLDGVEQNGKVIYLKGGIKTHFTKYGDGNLSFNSAYKEWCISRQLEIVMPGLNQKCLVLGHHRDNPKQGRLITRKNCLIRVGTLQYLKGSYNPSLIPAALDYLKQVAGHEEWSNSQLLGHIDACFKRQANLLYRHMFVHGCLSTDNIDPFAGLLDYGHSYFYNTEAEEAAKEFDPNGWYTYANQDKALNFALKILEEIIL